MNPLQPFLDGPIAHRTYHDVSQGRPENSWEGLGAAIDLGIAVEIDVQMSRDGVPMVFHDYILNRVTAKTGLVRDLNADELEAIPLTGGKRGMPRFDDFMNYVSGRIPVLVELKDQDGALGPKLSTLEPAVCEVLRGYDGPVGLMSFNPDMIARCAMLAPDVPRGLVTDPFTADDWPDVPKSRRDALAAIPHYDAIGATFISHNRSDLSTPRVAELKKSGAAVFCWTVRSKAQEEEALTVAQTITFESYIPESIT